ncbi:hypothetical protein ACLB2K_046766 [Fragaria x ananassa]
MDALRKLATRIRKPCADIELLLLPNQAIYTQEQQDELTEVVGSDNGHDYRAWESQLANNMHASIFFILSGLHNFFISISAKLHVKIERRRMKLRSLEYEVWDVET